MRLKIIVIEKKRIIVDTLRNTLKKHYTFRSISNIEEISKFTDSFQPDIVILGEITMVLKDAIKYIRRVFPNSKIILLYRDEPSKERILENIIAGIDGYIPSGWGIKEIKKGLEYLLKEGILLPREMVYLLVKEIRRLSFGFKKMEEEYDLTDKDREILKLLAEGNTNKEISNLLGVTEKSIKNRLYQIYRKLKVKNQREAISKFYSFFLP